MTHDPQLQGEARRHPRTTSLAEASEETLLHELRASALAAITIIGEAAQADANPHTADLDAYDLARIFCPGMNDRDNVAKTIDSLATTISLTRGRGTPSRAGARRRARALWVAWELTRLGEPGLADRFAELARDPS